MAEGFFFCCYLYVLPLKEEREEDEGGSRSLLEVKQKAFEGLLRIEVG